MNGLIQDPWSFGSSKNIDRCSRVRNSLRCRISGAWFQDEELRLNSSALVNEMVHVTSPFRELEWPEAQMLWTVRTILHPASVLLSSCSGLFAGSPDCRIFRAHYLDCSSPALSVQFSGLFLYYCYTAGS